MIKRLCSIDEWRDLRGTFIALWTSNGFAYALFEEELAATALQDGAYPALSAKFPGAAWFERLAHDLNGHVATGAELPPAIEQFRGADGKAAWPEFSLSASEGVHQLAMGPVHGSLAEPGHFRFSLRGEEVLKLEIRLGYSHKGTLALMRGKSPRLAARFAARISGDSTVAHSIAFARAAEAALALPAPPRAVALRAVMAEVERIANHCGDLGGVADAAGFLVLDSRFGWHRECFCSAADAAFGHRLMMDAVIPGGIAADIAGGEVLLRALAGLEAELPALTRMFEDVASLQDRLAIGVVPDALAARYAAGGVVGRASGRRTDARSPGYPPYDRLAVQVPTEPDGDVAARVKIRLAELRESIRLIRRLLDDLPVGEFFLPPPAGSGEAYAVAEGFRGPVWVWIRLDAGMIADIFVADPSTLHWPLLEQAALTTTLADFPLLERSINPSCSGVDL